ncbi:MAG: glycosyltransferase family 87 protein [Myxococcota bacterium]
MMLLSAVSASLTSWLSGPNDFFWGNPIFEKDSWEILTRGFRIFLAMTGALALIYEIRARRMGERIPERTRRRLAWLFTVLAFGVYFDFGNPNTRYSEYYHRHELYHYYLGSKYFQEVGYTRLYECSLIAEVENGRLDQVKNREVRDLRVNLIKPVSETYILKDPDQCKKHFTKERWDTFKREIDWFYRSAAGSYWEGMQKDHGYNPPPVWSMTGKFFGSFHEASDGFFKVLASIDVLLHLGIVLLLNWAFGWRVMAVCTVFWGANAPADFYWTGGAFLRQDWLFFLVAAVCCARKRYFFLAGFALTWSALLRIFPGVFVVGWAIIIGLYLIQSIRRGPPKIPGDNAPPLLRYLHPDHRRVIAGCVVALATLVPASIVVCGAESYKEFYHHTLKTHQNTPLTNHMGLESMVVHNWEGRMRFGRDDNLSDPFEGWKKGRIERFRKLKPLFIGIVLAVFAWTVWALRRTKLLWVGTALSLPIVMCLTNLTCYYYCMFLIGGVLVAARPQLGVPFLVTSGIGKMLQYSPAGFYWVDDRWVAESWLYFLLCLILLAGYSRPFSLERLKAWWDGKPEPKSKPRALPPSTVETAG